MTRQRNAHRAPNPRKTVDVAKLREEIGRRLKIGEPIGMTAVSEIAELNRTAWREYEDPRSKKVVPPGVVKLVCFVVALDELEAAEYAGEDVATLLGLAPGAPITITAVYDFLAHFWGDWDPRAERDEETV